jgi:succinate dehydrogenase/fumarate reductase cytochrome b subunit
MSDEHESRVERGLMRLQAGSGALFAVFLLAHLVNQMVAAAGPAAYDGVQAELRAVYQVPAIEVALVGAPLVVHAVTSVLRVLRRRRRGQTTAPAVRTRLQRWSAAVLLLFIVGHVVATRGTSLVYAVFPGFEAIAFTMVWQPAWFIPYYAVFAVAALYHALHGLTLALPRLGLRGAGGRGARAAALWLVVIGSVLLLLGVAGFAGAFEAVRERAIAGDYARVLEDVGLVDRAALR